LTSYKMLLSQHSMILSHHNSLRIYVREYHKQHRHREAHFETHDIEKRCSDRI
jgi:hypothetical protein